MTTPLFPETDKYDGKPKTQSQKVYGVCDGPNRWVRMARNAHLRPTSAGAKLFLKRVKTADIVRDATNTAHAFTLIQYETVYQGKDMPRLRGAVERRRAFCSVHCLALQAQQSMGTSAASADQLIHAVNSTFIPRRVVDLDARLAIAVLDLATLQGERDCRVCGKPIVGDKTTVERIAEATAQTKQFVLIEGAFVSVSEVKVVSLTARDFELLDMFSTPDLRAAYVHEFGHRFDA